MVKKFLLISIFCVAALIMFNQSSKAQLRYGAGLFYGTWLNNPGLNLRAELGVGDTFVIVPMIDLSVPRFSTATFLNSASLHLHYNFEITEELLLYPLAGATMKSYLDFDNYGGTTVHHRLRLNPVGGAGGQLKMTEFFIVFAEGRLELGLPGNYGQFVSTIGVLIRPSN